MVAQAFSGKSGPDGICSVQVRLHVSVRPMRGGLAYVYGMLLTLLPSRYREHEVLRANAITCGILQTFGAFLLLVLRLFDFVDNNSGSIGARSELLYDHIGGGAVYASGVFVIAEFAFHPVSILGYYFFFEGVVRTMGALIAHQVIGTLPLYVVAAVHGLWSKAEHRKYLGALVEDEVVRGTARSDYDLKVYSCRPKLDWNPYVTIEFENQFYQLMREEPGPESFRFVYYLRKNPVGRIVVQIFHYKTDDVLKPPAPKVYPAEHAGSSPPSRQLEFVPRSDPPKR